MHRYLHPLSLTEARRPILKDDPVQEIELVVAHNTSVYLGEQKKYTNGTATLTNLRLCFVNSTTSLFIPLNCIKEVDQKHKIIGFSSPKLVLHLLDSPPPPGYLKLSFHEGNLEQFLLGIQEALKFEAWKVQSKVEKKKESSTGGLSQLAGSAGITAILRIKEKEQKEAETTLNEAFHDLDGLMRLAKDLVQMSEGYVKKIQDAKNNGEAGEGENDEINSVMMSLGIVSPITKQSAGDAYYTELARQFFDFISPLVQKEGGVMMLVDAYCLFNRARGTALISPEDLVATCKEAERLRLPLSCKKLPSGVVVLQTASHSDAKMGAQIVKLIEMHGALSAVELSKHLKISLALAKQHLLTSEGLTLLCRDDSPDGIHFYKNIFL